MISALAMLACPNLAVPPQLMVHVAMVESQANPFAIGVVGGRLARQPRDAAEAIATARMLEAGGYNFSLGLAQVNRANLARYGLDTYEKAFDICPNLVAGSRILSACYEGAGGAWDKAFSCYYAGDHTTGFRDGYVQKIFASLGAGKEPAMGNAAATSIPVLPFPGSTPRRAPGSTPPGASHAARRVALRTIALDAALASAPHLSMTGDAAAIDTAAPPTHPAASPAPGASAGVATALAAAASGPPAAAGGAAFIPRVTVPGEHPAVAPPAPAGAAPSVDPADLRHGTEDPAFVF